VLDHLYWVVARQSVDQIYYNIFPHSIIKIWTPSQWSVFFLLSLTHSITATHNLNVSNNFCALTKYIIWNYHSYANINACEKCVIIITTTHLIINLSLNYVSGNCLVQSYILEGVQMKGIQNKKCISQKLFVIHVSSFSPERKTAWLMRMRQMVTFGELSNDVDTTGTRLMRVVASRVAISSGCPVSF
jgi:hypothetical protein